MAFGTKITGLFDVAAGLSIDQLPLWVNKLNPKQTYRLSVRAIGLGLVR